MNISGAKAPASLKVECLGRALELVVEYLRGKSPGLIEGFFAFPPATASPQNISGAKAPASLKDAPWTFAAGNAEQNISGAKAPASLKVLSGRHIVRKKAKYLRGKSPGLIEGPRWISWSRPGCAISPGQKPRPH